MSRFAGVSEAGARRRNPERSEGSGEERSVGERMVRPERIELEPFCGRERSGSPQAKSRAERGIWGRAKCRRKNGAPGENRTPNLLVRSQALYPIELRAHCGELRL